MNSFTRKRALKGIAIGMALLLCAAVPVSASEIPPKAQSAGLFSSELQEETGMILTGVFITGVPDQAQGVLRLGSRIIVPGDVLSAPQLEQLTLESNSPTQQEAVCTYLPIYGSTVAKEASLTLTLKGTQDQPPKATDSTLETYKNMENTGKFDVTDEEGGALTFTIVRQPRRGTVTVQEDGTFLFTPKKNKVGKDYFIYTATDAAGNVSNEATVTIEILKATDDRQYSDMTRETGRFEAMWMKNAGLFEGVQVADCLCFQPEASITRGEFLVMTMKLLNIPAEDAQTTSGFADEGEAPEWLRPYLVSAMRLGIAAGSPEAEAENAPVFRPNDPITRAEAAVMLQNILLLADSPTVSLSEEVPAWAADAASALSQAGVTLSINGDALCRRDAAIALYQVSKLMDTAPGLEVFREQD